MTTPKTILAEYNRATGVEADLQRQITALAARVTALEHPVVVRSLPATTTGAQFLAAVADLTIDVIELTAGTYHWPSLTINVDRHTRPLLVRQAAGATVIFAGDKATSQGGQFYFGLGGAASDIIFAPGFIFDGYGLGSTGIVWMGNAKRCSFTGGTARNVTSSTPTNSWAVYLSVDGSVSPDDVDVSGWTVQGTNRNFSALQVGHPPSTMNRITANGWKVSSCSIALYAYGTVNGLTVDTWAITDCKRDDRPGTVFFGPQVTGTFSNMHSDLGTLESQGGMTRGTGNVGI